jgi:DNA-binding PadR family transcriptional regulator
MPSDAGPNPLSFLPLHPLEFRILMILMDGPSHGYAVVQEIEAWEGGAGKIYPANLYRRIRDLLARGLLEDADAPRSGEADSRRRYFRITGLGKAVVAAETHRLQDLLDEARARGLMTAKG